MDDLSCQLELSDSFDSGNATDEEDEVEEQVEDAPEVAEEEEEEEETDDDGERVLMLMAGAQFLPCEQCNRITTEDLSLCLRRCGRLLLSSARSTRRLRRLCCRRRARHARTRRALAQAREKADAGDAAAGALRAALRDAGEELRRRTQEVRKELVVAAAAALARPATSQSAPFLQLQDAQAKMNDNYKLMAEISNENLRLAGEKLRMEELLEEVRVARQTSSRSHHHHPRGRRQQQQEQRTAGWEPETQPSSSSSSTQLPLPPSSDAALEGPPQRCHSSSRHRQQHHRQQQQQQYHHHRRWKGHHHHHHHRRHRGGEEVTPFQEKIKSARTDQSPSQDLGGTQEQQSVSSSASVVVAAATAADTISSPDLGVDVSSDPFSSLERAKGYLSESLARGGRIRHGILGPLTLFSSCFPDPVTHRSRHHQQTQPQQQQQQQQQQQHPQPYRVETMVVENRQLRRERDLLMQKLMRSKGALKETLDKLGQPQAAPQGAGNGAGRGPCSESEGGGGSSRNSSRARVTRELREFSRSARAAVPRTDHEC